MKKIIILFFITLIFINLCKSQTFIQTTDSIPMRDGKKLAADIYLPSTPGTYPVILVQTPYNRLYYRINQPLGLGSLTGLPYALVVVDWRGFYGSASAMVANPDRGKDGYDIVEWIATQTWSNGKVGTWGPFCAWKKSNFKPLKKIRLISPAAFHLYLVVSSATPTTFPVESIAKNTWTSSTTSDSDYPLFC